MKTPRIKVNHCINPLLQLIYFKNIVWHKTEIFKKTIHYDYCHDYALKNYKNIKATIAIINVTCIFTTM